MVDQRRKKLSKKISEIVDEKRRQRENIMVYPY